MINTSKIKWYCPFIESHVPPCPNSCDDRCIPTCLKNILDGEEKAKFIREKVILRYRDVFEALS